MQIMESRKEPNKDKENEGMYLSIYIKYVTSNLIMPFNVLVASTMTKLKLANSQLYELLTPGTWRKTSHNLPINVVDYAAPIPISAAVRPIGARSSYFQG